MLKNITAPLILTIAYIGLPLLMPWWSVAIPAVIFGYFAHDRLNAFSQSSSILAIIWGLWSHLQNTANSGLLANKMGNLLGGVNALHLILLTAALGGLIGGLFGLLGYSLKTLFR